MIKLRVAVARFSLAAAVWVVACSSRPGHVSRPTPTIVVIEPGAEPRQRVRYEPAPGLVERIETSAKVRITNNFTNTVLQDGRRVADYPTIITRGRLEVTGRSPEGDALVSFATEDVHTLEDVVDPKLRRAVNAQLWRYKGARGTWRLLPTGQIEDVKIEPPIEIPIKEMFVQFPDADIGVGAIWQIESEITVDSVTWIGKATYTLRELTDGQAVVDVSVARRAPSQDLRVEPNLTTKLTSGTGTISGLAFVPRRGLVLSGSFEGTSEANFLIVQGHLRISSTLRTETFSSTKRIEPGI